LNRVVALRDYLCASEITRRASAHWLPKTVRLRRAERAGTPPPHPVMVRAVVPGPSGAPNDLPVVADSGGAWGAAETRTGANLRLCRNCGSSDEDRADNGSGEPKS
jgi:hypothetical protein